MNESLYFYSLFLSLPLMLFFGVHMLVARTPEKGIFRNFILSRRLMGIAILILAANYMVHLFGEMRQKDVNATILMNLSTYFLCYWLFSSAMMLLLDSSYVTRKRFLQHIAMWLAFSILSSFTLLLPSSENYQTWCIGILAVVLVAYGLLLSIRLIKSYYRAIQLFDNTHSDDIGSYVRWLSIFTYWAIGYGVSCGLLTFLPNEYVFIWILSSIPFYIYLYCCYQNYLLFYETVENAFSEDLKPDEIISTCNDSGDITPSYHEEISERIKDWIDQQGYCIPGITINDLAKQIKTNRTYLSEYIKSTYGKTYRDWVADLRIEYAKRLMHNQPELKNLEISESSGFLSISHFIRTFNDKEGCSPGRWRSKNLSLTAAL